MALWIFLAFLVVMSILFFAFNLFVRQRSVQAHAVHFGEVAYGLAESGINIGFHQIRLQCRDRNSSLYKTLVDSSCAALTGKDLPLKLAGEIDVLLLDLGTDRSLTVEAKIVKAESLETSAENGCDPIEKRLLLEVRAVARFQGIRREVVQRRPMKIQLDLLPVLSRFTLFVKRPEVQSADEPGYNLFANDINGAPDAAAAKNYLPLRLFNHGDTFRNTAADPKTSGFVFLGGSDSVVLRLSAGMHHTYGQYFHLYDSLVVTPTTQPAFFSASPPPFFYPRTHAVNGRTHGYYIKHVACGYYTADKAQPPTDMNKNGYLKRHFKGNPASARKKMRSSVLHLFGTTLCPSPTTVVGPVFHSWALYSGVTVDEDGDGKRDGLVAILPAIDEADWSRLPTDWPIPTTVRNISNPGGQIRLDPNLTTYARMFGDYATYARYQSTLIAMEPYNYANDYILGKGDFPAKAHVLDENGDYPNSGTNFEIRRSETSEGDGLHFKGDLNDVDSPLLRARAVIRVTNEAAFRAAFLRDGANLRLGCHVYVASGDVTLPANLKVLEGGALYCKGNISFDGIRCEVGQRLALVSLEGNIRSAFSNCDTNNPDQVALAALSGSVACTEESHALAIRGSLAARRLRPADFRGGGSVIYDTETDPASSKRKKFTRIYLADRAVEWSL